MPKKKVIKRKRVGEEKKERKVTKRYLNPRVALVISCLYFITFVLSPVKYDIFMVSMMSKISNAMFIISLVVSSMTIVEIYFGNIYSDEGKSTNCGENISSTTKSLSVFSIAFNNT